MPKARARGGIPPKRILALGGILFFLIFAAGSLFPEDGAPGEKGGVWEPSWTLRPAGAFSFNVSDLAGAGVFVFCAVGLFISLRGIREVMKETAALRTEAAAIFSGEIMPSEKKKLVPRIKRRGYGLRIKITFYTAILVMVVVLLVSFPFYIMTIHTQQNTLFLSLQDRAAVLLEGLSANAALYLSRGNMQELSYLPYQMNAISEARYVTITGYDPETQGIGELVWATNDPYIISKIDTPELRPGVSRLTDILSPRLRALSEELNVQAQERVSGLPKMITDLKVQADELDARAASPDDFMLLEQMDVAIRNQEYRISEVLARVGGGIRSEPPYSEDSLIPDDNRYIFYKPVMYYQGSEDEFSRGFVRLEVSINSILEKITEEQQNLLRTMVLVGLVAQAVGAVGAVALSSFLTRPIARLVRHVEIIRDTENKAKLKGVDIVLKSRDELAILGNTINDMTRGLVKAAIAASDLFIAKEIQKKFLPLDLDIEGNKLNSGLEETRYLSLFGYYEGAKGVSGDYFDYLDLDGRYYAIIKCDVAGKGIPAAFIMIQVATMFLNFFKRWEPTEKGMRIEEMVYQMNEFIEALAFKDRFAAFTLCLYDSQTGAARFCNAGDNLIRFFDASEGRIRTIALPETPAAGILPNPDVESRGGYKVQTITMDPGDMLFLYTDGIEESQRKFRDSEFREILCAEGSPNTPHGNHVAGQGVEELGGARILEIINAVMNKQVYRLRKFHNPEGEDQALQFDFSSARGDVETVIMALIAVEKIFRCYKNPEARENNRVMADKKVDAFLKEHFLQYQHYCAFSRKIPENSAYINYTYLEEDEQYDDLTILGFSRK